nr:DUF3524 domain-containing protein [Ardenticatena sp.]
MNILLIEPYDIGSHAVWARGVQQYSAHPVELLTLPGRFWKWRMHGAAVTLAPALLTRERMPDLILATDMLDVTTLLALTRPRTARTPVVTYFHENQLTYPFPPGTKRDLHYGWINYVSALASNAVAFNSAYHRDEFFDELPRLLKHFPDYNNLETIEALRARTTVLHPGLDLSWIDEPDPPGVADDLPPRGSHPPLILWNQRWEYDKGPDTFFWALDRLAERGIPFRLALAGESFRLKPQEFLDARERFRDRIVHFGYAETPRYRALLRRADLVVSTAIHEFFGLAVIEAIAAGCFPVLPKALAYPEYIPPNLHEAVFYTTREALVEKLATYLQDGVPRVGESLRAAMRRFDWRSQRDAYDTFFEQVVAKARASSS